MFSNLLYFVYLLALTLFVEEGLVPVWITLLAVLPLGAFTYFTHLKLKKTLLISLAYLTALTFLKLISWSPLLVLTFIFNLWLHTLRSPWDKKAFRFLLPFTLPYLIISPFSLFLNEDWTLILSFLLMIAMFAFFPFIVQKIWQSKPIEPSPLKSELETLCEKAHFKHGGLLEWTLLSGYITAGIMGVIPKFRYVLFTPSLLRNLKPTSIQAVLAHEMGHHFYKHLWIFPILILSVVYTAGWLTYLLPIENAWISNLAFIVIALIYARIVGGFYSRLFERQADLYPLKLGLPIEYTVDALEEVAQASGSSKTKPSWHHFSIDERVKFLEEVKNDPKIIVKHNRKTTIAIFFLIIYVITIMLLVYVNDF